MGKLSDILRAELAALEEYEKAIEMTPEEEEKAINEVTAANTRSIEQIGRTMDFSSFLESQAERLKNEAERLTTARRRLERIQESIKWHTLNYMIETGQTALEAGTYRLSIGESEATIIDNEQALPQDLAPRIITIKPDKTAIKKAIKAGLDVPGAHLVKSQFLRIK